MKSDVMKTVSQCMQALGPIFHEVKDYETIRLAMCVVISKVIQATPERGREIEIRDISFNDIEHALDQLLEIEAASKAKLDAGIAGFAEFAGEAKLNGHATALPIVINTQVDPHLAGDAETGEEEEEGDTREFLDSSWREEPQEEA